MNLVAVTVPLTLAVTEESAWEHLRLPLFLNGASPQVLEPEDKDLVRRYIEGAIADVDGRDGLLGRALITQEWALTIDFRFPSVIEVPLPPCQAIESITYVDSAGAIQTLAESAYRVAGIGGAGKAAISPAAEASWPSTSSVPEAVTVAFTAGYGDEPDDVPAAIRSAILETVGARYAFRESITPGAQYFPLPRSAQESLDAYRMWGF